MLVLGARQVGKTTLIREFANQHYQTLLEVNFFDNRSAIETISMARDAADLFLRLSVIAKKEVTPGSTLVFLDEIQEFTRMAGKSSFEALTWVKFLLERTDCDYIFSGSMLGIELISTSSFPVGFLTTVTMYPMDFEEFCWACGIGDTPISVLSQCVASRKALPDFLHDELMDLFYKYLLVGGMPDAVQAFQRTGLLDSPRAIQKGIVELYRADIAKYVSDPMEARQIRMVFDAVPGQLNQANKRFKYSRLGKNLRFANLETAFDWIGHAGIALPTIKVDAPLFPLGLYEDRNALKLYSNDVGLLTAQLMGNVNLEILNRRSTINFGSVFENVAAQELLAHGQPLYYYNSNSGGEIDFVGQTSSGDIVLREIKSGKGYRRHSALNNLLAVKNYDISDALVYCDDNVSVEGRVTHLPIYALGFTV